MALTDQEKADIIYQLGWPGLTIVPNSTDYSKPIVDNLTTPTAQMEVQIRALLERLSKLDLKIEAATCRLSASQVGDIKLNENELHFLRKEKKMLLRELSDLLDIAIVRQGGSNPSVLV